MKLDGDEIHPRIFFGSPAEIISTTQAGLLDTWYEELSWQDLRNIIFSGS